MGLKQRCNNVLIGMMKAVEGLAILGLICTALSLTTHAQVVTATIPVGIYPSALSVDSDRADRATFSKAFIMRANSLSSVSRLFIAFSIRARSLATSASSSKKVFI